MNSTRMMAVSLLGLTVSAACIDPAEEPGDANEEARSGANGGAAGEGVALSEHTSALVIGAAYCVKVSSTGAYQSTLPAGPPACTGFGSTFPVNATLTLGHALRISANCGNPAFVNARSVSTGAYYMLRVSALQAC